MSSAWLLRFVQVVSSEEEEEVQFSRLKRALQKIQDYGDLAFCHPNIGLEPDCQSFEFSDSDLESTEHKSGNWKVKKIENKIPIDLKRNEEDAEAGLENFVEPVSHPSHDVELFKDSANAIIHESPKEIEPFENLPDIYTDKSVTEYEPELTVCYRENDDHMIKDICIDEGVPAKDKILFENSVGAEDVYKFLPSESYENEELMKEKVGISVPFSVTEESDEASANPCDSKVLIQNDEDAAENPSDNVHETVLPGDKVLLQDLFDREKSRPSIDKGDEIEHNHEQVCGEPDSQSKPDELENKDEEAVLASPATAPIVNDSNSDGMAENGSITDKLDPAACSKEEHEQVSGSKRMETQNMAEAANGKHDEQVVTNEFRQSLGESSFSAVGPVSARISYSGPVPYSGSISLRSDSSTTSTRSFAFPVVQSEWNSSPVRMAKADRRHYRKHRGWRHGLLCCRF
ncbi:hypothetical protein L6164_001876 [Bauhinia variegata]|uniref:Uncharacterized protein n=1 Tax=Bauhinia variegata TaxID=167791 RepID=A0ACB9QDE1_BAUVA|nr:hypothetical protein L6164_001876 [Bauhinia variegata]